MNSNQAHGMLSKATKNVADAQVEYFSAVDSEDDTGLTFAMTLATIAQTQALIVIAKQIEKLVDIYEDK